MSSTTTLLKTRLALAATLALGISAAQAGTPFPTAKTPAAHEVGAVAAAPITVTVALKLRNQQELEALVAAQHTPGSASYRKFLSSAEFQQRFAPSAATVDAAKAHFTQAGLSVTVEHGRLLKVTGAPATIQSTFNVSLRQFEIPAHGKLGAQRFHAAVGTPQIASASVAASVDAVVGLDSRARYAPRSVHAAAAAPRLQRMQAAPRTAVGNSPGNWTVSDLAAYYNVNPLYAKGVHGEGTTVGIVTLASFTPADAFDYWANVGLTVDANRLTVIDVDGGPGAPSDSSGSSETTLDVEQSGGLAPAAAMRVYQAPNTDAAFVDAFAMAIGENIADTISVSWGSFEYFNTLTRIPTEGGNVEVLHVFNQLFLQAAAQGQSMFAAAGDAGAYDVNRALPLPEFTAALSVDSPASSQWITAAGGTTLPGTMVFTGADGGPFPITIPTEQAWGWSYLTGLCAGYGVDPVGCGIFPVGGGGGVSFLNRQAVYQTGAGFNRTEAGQSVIDTLYGIDYLDIPAGFRGRNLPDVSMNADPETGYLVDYTSDVYGPGWLSYYGGTSFVAPQLNGITALLAQKAGSRIGLLNFSLYALAKKPMSYTGHNAPLRDITAGDNWFYTGKPGYDQATGVGTIDVTKLAKALSN